MGEIRVDLQHLLEDLRDAYTGALEETILTEIAANALDSGATRLSLQPATAPSGSTTRIRPICGRQPRARPGTTPR